MHEHTNDDADAAPAEPAARRAPPPGRKFPCPRCGARLDFDPGLRGLACPYCSYREDVSDSGGEVLERDYLLYLDKFSAAVEIQPIAGHANETRCGGCGATVILDDRIAADKCPFCHTFLEGKVCPVRELIQPESVMPFRVDLRTARGRFNAWLEGLWFAPSELVKIANLGQLTGVYVPYWTYDSMTYTRYTGERGDDYTEYVSHTVRDANGIARTESRPVKRIRWSHASGEVEHFFDDVLVCASKSLPEKLIDGLAPWHLRELVPFEAGYLSGFQAEHYAIDLPGGLAIAKGIMQGVIVRLVQQDIGGDHQRIHSMKTRHTAITFKHTLMPVWVAVYRYRDTVYRILINGQTGKIVGKRPWSTWKIVRLILLIVLGIAAAVAIFGGIGAMGR